LVKHAIEGEKLAPTLQNKDSPHPKTQRVNIKRAIAH
jgi:hypothetical protein